MATTQPTLKTGKTLKTFGLFGLLCVLYFGLELRHLASAPLVHQDESWIASPAANLALYGVYGDPLFTGFYQQESAYFGFPPLYPMLLALVFKLIGVGVVQARLLSVGAGFVILLLTFALGQILFRQDKANLAELQFPTTVSSNITNNVGLLACTLLLLARFSWGGQLQISGIPLIDQARIVRYDILAPVFGLAAWLLYQHNRTKQPFYYLLIGILCGLSGLSHLFGLVWLPTLLILLLVERGWRLLQTPAPYLLVVGVLLAWLPWLIYGWLNSAALVGQSLEYQDQFRLFAPDFYLTNLLNEPNRYLQGMGWRQAGVNWLLSPTNWLLMLSLLLVLIFCRRRNWRFANPGLCSTLLVLGTINLLFALFLKNKTPTYAIIIWPVLALLLAWTINFLWYKARTLYQFNLIRGRLLQIGLLIWLAALGWEGLLGWNRLEQAGEATPFEAYFQDVAANFPPDARIIALHSYWLGLHQYPYRALTTAFFRSEPGFSNPPVPFELALNELEGNILLLERQMQAFLREVASPANPRHYQGEAFKAWMQARSARLLATVNNEYYGTIEIYQLAPRR